jgi:hypothetical protein
MTHLSEGLKRELSDGRAVTLSGTQERNSLWKVLRLSSAGRMVHTPHNVHFLSRCSGEGELKAGARPVRWDRLFVRIYKHCRLIGKSGCLASANESSSWNQAPQDPTLVGLGS